MPTYEEPDFIRFNKTRTAPIMELRLAFTLHDFRQSPRWIPARILSAVLSSNGGGEASAESDAQKHLAARGRMSHDVGRVGVLWASRRRGYVS